MNYIIYKECKKLGEEAVFGRGTPIPKELVDSIMAKFDASERNPEDKELHSYNLWYNLFINCKAELEGIKR